MKHVTTLKYPFYIFIFYIGFSFMFIDYLRTFLLITSYKAHAQEQELPLFCTDTLRRNYDC